MVAGSSPVASCMTSFTPHLLFLGSQAGDGLLVRHAFAAAVPRSLGMAPSLSGGLSSFTSMGAPAAVGSSLPGGLDPGAKRRRLMSLASFEMGGGHEGDTEGPGPAAMSASKAAAGAGGGEAGLR
jgi:hypothetical protein